MPNRRRGAASGIPRPSHVERQHRFGAAGCDSICARRSVNVRDSLGNAASVPGQDADVGLRRQPAVA